MALMTLEEYHFSTAISRLAYSNAFLPERIDCEREALGPDFVERDAFWNLRIESGGMHANIERLVQRAGCLAEILRERLAGGQPAGQQELSLYEDLVLFFVYHQRLPEMRAVVFRPEGRHRDRVEFYPDFVGDFEHFLRIPGVRLPTGWEPAHLFACCFQLTRAFQHTFENIIGASEPVMRLRAAVWQSIFTHDMRRYRRVLFDRMGDIACLITGPSGTGKELVARAIGLSRYIPFDAKTQTFTEDCLGSFHALNLSALSPTLIEAELFGHRRGAFTGALGDRTGWLEECRPLGTVFLDEIGELDSGLQVKLLRVLQTRTFQRLGESKPRTFRGKIMAATNRDLAEEMQAGRFREDLYYRLCSDIIVTPPLREQIAAEPSELRLLVLHVARRLIGAEAEPLAAEVLAWIHEHLGPAYPWPGNVRELEQCVRNVMIRGHYRPARPPRPNTQEQFLEAVRVGTLTADALLNGYCQLVHEQTGSYLATARRLGLDRRTVKTRVAAASAHLPAPAPPQARAT